MRTSAVLALLLLAVACAGRRSREITPLARAARDGDAPAIAAMVKAGQDPNGIDLGLNHWTPLLHAIHKNQVDSVDALLAAGADANRASPGGNTPLLMAVGNGQTPLVRRLLDAGADPHVDGSEMLATAISGGALTDIEQPLLGRCNTAVVRMLLQRAPDLRLQPGVRTRVAIMFPRWNQCDEAMRLVRRTSNDAL
jgi:ankyrin repeat protein